MKAIKRIKKKMDHGWMFHKGDIPVLNSVKAGMAGGLTDCETNPGGYWMDIAFCDKVSQDRMNPAEWKEVDLPHDWCVEGSYVNDNELGAAPGSSGYLPVGTGCYRKVFSVPSDYRDGKMFILFDGIMRNSTIWLNGHRVGTHASGYTSFYFDITDILRYGPEEGENVLFIKVEATEYEGWWYDGCGIYRHVWLIGCSRLHVGLWGVYVTTPIVEETCALINIKTTIKNDQLENQQFELISSILDDSGFCVAKVVTEADAAGMGIITLEQEVEIKFPHLWSPDSPYLYKIFTEICQKDATIDEYETIFGIRKIEFTNDRGFFLNGQPMLLKGTCNHQDFAGLGVALPDSIIEYKLRLLKEMGSNALRCAHHPPAPELLDICDRIGLLVIDENRKLDSSEQGLKELRSMILRDRNHPSVILWCLENEEILEGTRMGARILDTLSRHAEYLDPTRPTVAAINHQWHQSGYSDKVKIVGYNYGHTDKRYIEHHKQYPQKIFLCTESVACTTTRGIYQKDTAKGYCPQYWIDYPEWASDPETSWLDLLENPHLTGIFVWSGFDYRGEPTPYTWPCVSSHFGLMDICGFPKDIYYYFKAAWTKEVVLHIFPHWNWNGMEGNKISIWAFTNCEEVELFVNGERQGRKQVIQNRHLEWDVEYIPGELKAVGYRDGSEIVAVLRRTTGLPYQILLDANKSAIRADGCDTSVIRVSIADEKGDIVPTADNEVFFTLQGPGKIIGVGNGDPSSHESDKENHRRAFNGYCMAIVQSTGDNGWITLRAHSEGLMPSVIRLEAAK